MENTIKVIIVEDNDTFREGLKMLLLSLPHYELLEESTNYFEIAGKNIFHKADIVLMDLMMPDISGIDAAKQILWEHPKVPILAITMFTDNAYLLELMGAGFKGCVFKSNIYNELDSAMKCVLSGKRYFPADIKLKK